MPQLAGLGGGWCRLELSGLGKRWSSFWRKSSNRKASGDSGGFEFLEFFLPYKHSGQKDLSGWRLPAPMLEQTVVHLIRQHVDATTFSASLIHTPTMQELASVRRFLDGLCSGSNGSNNDSASAAPLLRLIRRVDISPGSVSILLDRNAFAACLSMGPDRIREDALRIHAPFRLRRRGVETKLVLGNPTKSVDRTVPSIYSSARPELD